MLRKEREAWAGQMFGARRSHVTKELSLKKIRYLRDNVIGPRRRHPKLLGL